MILLSLIACNHPESAPPTLRDLSLVAIQEFDSDGEEEIIQRLVDCLGTFVSDEPYGVGFDHLAPEDVADIPHDEELVEWDRTGGAGVMARMRGAVPDYAATVPDPDQSWAEPSTYIAWDRTITDGTAEEFLAGADLGTWNHIEKGGPLGIVVPYDMDKDYRWFGDVLAQRSVVPEPGFDEGGDNGIIIGFTIEIWYTDDVGMVWYNGSWSQLKTIVDDIVSEDLLVQELIDGTLDYFWGTEEHVTGTAHE